MKNIEILNILVKIKYFGHNLKHFGWNCQYFGRNPENFGQNLENLVEFSNIFVEN